ncbi:hypothetical protein ACLB2K_048339 [Fragaria x ananassa]
MSMLVDHLFIVKVQQSSPGRVSFEAGDREEHFLSCRRTPQLALEEIKKSKTRSTPRLECRLGGTGTGFVLGAFDWSMDILYIKSPLKKCLERELGGTCSR